MPDAPAFDSAATIRLFEAVDKNRVAEALRALDEGADPNGIEGETGNRPLMICALHHLHVVSKALLEKGANPDAARKGGDTALILCAFSNDRETARLLVEAGANILKQNNSNEDVMMRCSRESNRELGDLIEKWAKERKLRLKAEQTAAALRQNTRDVVSGVQEGLSSPLHVKGPLRLKGPLHA